MVSRTRTVGVVLALACGLATFGAHVHAAPAATAKVSSTCWQDIVNDWLDNNGQIKSTYPIPCYRQAIQHLNNYADIKGYSNILDDIRRAQVAALHNPGGGSNNSSGGGNGPTSGGGNGNSSPPPSADRSWVQKVTDKLGPGDARSIPLPLLVLGALALLLLLAAGGTWLAKRMQARRVTPVPVPRDPS